MAKKPFSIDDAFDENLDDVVVRVYGSTTIERPFNGTSSNSNRTVNVVNRPETTSSSSHGMHHPHPHPVLLSIRTGIMPDDVSLIQ